MPIDPGTAKQLADAGGWAVAIFETALIAVLVLRGAAKRWYVMGWLYDRTEARADTADLQVERTITAITAMTAQTRQVEFDKRFFLPAIVRS